MPIFQKKIQEANEIKSKSMGVIARSSTLTTIIPNTTMIKEIPPYTYIRTSEDWFTKGDIMIPSRGSSQFVVVKVIGRPWWRRFIRWLGWTQIRVDCYKTIQIKKKG